MKPQDIYDHVTNLIISLLEDHQETWDKPWLSLDCENEPPHNPLTPHYYSGINMFILSLYMNAMGYPKNTWATYRQIQKAGGHVNKGEKSISVIFYKSLYKDKDGNAVKAQDVCNASSRDLKDNGVEFIPMLKTFRVFNLAQTSGLADKFYEVSPKHMLEHWEKNEAAENLILATKAKIEIKHSNRAYYDRTADKIVLPLREQFNGAIEFYDTALHELGHWTGAPQRLNRAFGKFGDTQYAVEELIAELTSAYCTSRLGFEKTMSNNVSYINSWLSILKQDNKAIFKAAAKAQKAADYIFDLARTPHLSEMSLAP